MQGNKKIYWGFLFILSLITLSITILYGVYSQNIAEGKVNLSMIKNQDQIIYDKSYAQNYLNQRQNFSELSFENIDLKKEFILSVGNKINDLKGIKINQSNFAIHLVYCNEFEKFCKFRINGVPTTKLYPLKMADIEKNNSFEFETDYILKINSVKFNQCDTHRFCNLGFEGYHQINISIEKKGKYAVVK